MKTLNKKGQGISFLQGAGIALGILVVTLAVLAQMLGNIRTTQTINSSEYNITTQGLGAFTTFGQNLGTIALVLVLVVIIGLFAFLGRRQQ